jgi:hypothetical protein
MQIGQPFLKRFLAIAFCFIAMANSSVAANIATVDATGRAALSGHSEQQARRFALEDALYLAALQNGVRISGTLVSHNGVLLRDIITQNSDAKLVDFKILKENKSPTHYQVTIRAFFAESARQSCANPRFEKALVLRPSVSVGQKVHAHHVALGPELGKAITQYISQNYPGPLNRGEMMSFADFKKRQSPQKMLNYKSLQSNQLGVVEAALLISTDVKLRSGNGGVHAMISLSAISAQNLTEVFSSNLQILAPLSAKTPFRTLNLLDARSPVFDLMTVFGAIDHMIGHFNLASCAPLQGSLALAGENLIFPHGQNAGIKRGALAYVTTGEHAWVLLEALDVMAGKTTMRPINNFQSSESLAGQTVQIIEGTF